VSREPLAFFTVDYGTATTAAALISRLGGRFRLLASISVPAGLPVEPMLQGLVDQVIRIDRHALEGSESWPYWARLEAGSFVPGRLVLAAATERRLQQLATAVAGAGWEIGPLITPERTDALAATQACLAPELAGIAIGASEPPSLDERDALPDLCALLGAVATRRGDLLCLLTGAAGEHADKFPQEQVVLGPAPEALPAAAPSPLRQLAEDLAGQRAPRRGGGVPLPDVRRGFRTSIASLAALLERRVEGVDVGHSAGARVLATPEGVRGDVVRADGALVPAAALDDDRMIDSILRWSPVRADTFDLRDRVRNLRLAPWREASGDGAPLRLAAARAALSRLDAAWALTDEPDGRPANKAADLLIASGGAFSVAPPPAVALALVDTLRRPGGLALFHDHARLLGPLGTLESEADRRRLLADLLDDALVPLGSAILAIGLRPGRHAGTLRVTSDGAVTELELVPGTVQLVDLPPGLAATAELETREGAWLGVRAKRIALDVAGGLGGLLVDTREIPLRLPERAERRRELLEAWQRPLWTGAEQ
jgi:hypothetical protein